MPTFERLPRFDADWNKLSKEQQDQFRIAGEKFVDDLPRGEGFRVGLRVKPVRGTPGSGDDFGRTTGERPGSTAPSSRLAKHM